MNTPNEYTAEASSSSPCRDCGTEIRQAPRGRRIERCEPCKKARVAVIAKAKYQRGKARAAAAGSRPCKTCGKVTAAEDFTPSKDVCRPCTNEYMRGLRRGWAEEVKELFVDGTVACAKCGCQTKQEDFSLATLDCATCRREAIDAAWEKKDLPPCKQCGGKVTYQGAGPRSVYCSPTCRVHARREKQNAKNKEKREAKENGLVSKPCKQCASLISPEKQKRGRLYCSVECQRAGMRERQDAFRARRRGNGPESKPCKQCEALIPPERQTGRRVYCSDECATVGRKIREADARKRRRNEEN